MRIIFSILIGIGIIFQAQAQGFEDELEQLQESAVELDEQKQALLKQMEGIKFQIIQRDLDAVGLPALFPGDQLVRHSALVLAYCEAHEQARWVAHIIVPDVISGVVFRSNDFRPDTLVTTGSAVEADYFLKYLQPDSSYVYDGFGFDRGHLAPSADFRWSQTALSESYFYSNMSPQLADFNRGSWGELEDKIRGYLYAHPQVQLYVVTGPVLEPGLPVVERGVNKVSIPRQYWKVALDLQNRKAIGFVMPNRAIAEPLSAFAATIDEVEALTGLDFFSKLPDDLEPALELQKNPADWLPEAAVGDVAPIAAVSLPPNHFNTTQSRLYQNKNDVINVCGTVVSARKSRAGNILLNLDRQFPNQVFTVFIKKAFIPNFSYDPVTALKGKAICVKGRVMSLDGVSAMFIEGERELRMY